MEDRGKRKLLATEGLVDRLSNVPDDVAQQILSSLKIKDLIRFGCVSKKCQQLHLSTPSLNFNGFSRRILQSYDQRLTLWSYLDTYLSNRGDNKIECFHLSLELHNDSQHNGIRDDERFRLEKWICNAIRCNVKVLGIKIKRRPETLTLPHCVLLGESLKSLAVQYARISKTPSLASFSNLECLKLQLVIVPDDGLFKWISSSCKCLEELSLIHVIGCMRMNVTIESSSLESLCIKGYDYFMGPLYIAGGKLRKVIINRRFGFWTDKPHTDRSLYIHAPNLNSLNWTGNLMNQPNLGRLECLEEATIGLLPNADEFVYVSEVLSRLSCAKVLTLNKETTMALFNGGSMPLLENVCYLCIHIQDFLDILGPAMTSFLGGMCKLKTLIIKSDPFFRDSKADCHGFDMGYWKLQNTAFMNQLKEVTIELSNGSNGFEFARYILDHPQNLKKMTLVHSPQHSDAMSKLNKSKMTSNIKLDFQVDLERGNRTGSEDGLPDVRS